MNRIELINVVYQNSFCNVIEVSLIISKLKIETHSWTKNKNPSLLLVKVCKRVLHWLYTDGVVLGQ